MIGEFITKENKNQYYENDYEEQKLQFKFLRPNYTQKKKYGGDPSKLINCDNENKFTAISRKFLLGDVVFLETVSENRLFFEGNNGDEGDTFKGKIWKNLAFVATLNYDFIKT